MNAILATDFPLPSCLDPFASPNAHRRHRIGRIDLDPRAIDRFNLLLESVGGTPWTLDADRLATAARELRLCSISGIAPPCIRQRLRRVKAAVAMVADRNWQAAEDAVSVVRLVARYIAADDDLIPDAEPAYGRLDDAIVVQAAWPRVANEVLAYVDFRRLRRIATAPGDLRARFDRSAWMQARRDEAALLAQRLGVRERSYVSRPATLFRIH